MKMIATLTALLLVAACATPVSQEHLASSDYGQPPPDNYEEIIEARFSEILIDPTSPVYEIGKPHKGYTPKSWATNTPEHFGWVVCGTVNSKNRMGGYSGRRPFITLFRGAYIAKFTTGEARSNSVLNDGITKACNRYVP